MISRSDLRMIISAAKKGWMPDRDKRQLYFAQVRQALNSADANERLTETALAAQNAMQDAGWDLDLAAVQ